MHTKRLLIVKKKLKSAKISISFTLHHYIYSYFFFIIHKDIVEMDSKRTAHEKMLCITECSKNIYIALNIAASMTHTSNSEPQTPSGDEQPQLLITTNDESAGESQIQVTVTETNPNATKKSKPSGGNAKSLASADDYLPAFIYIVLKANPTMLYSNMNFISRFAFEKRILQGEHAYHFCSLVS
jgi:hypothetical protein